LGPNGKLYAAVVSGNILSMDPDGTAQEVFANTGGQVLGFDLVAMKKRPRRAAIFYSTLLKALALALQTGQVSGGAPSQV